VIVFISRYFSNPHLPPSQPFPDCLKPPMMAKNIDSKIEEAQKLRDEGVKAHEDGKLAESEKLLNQALKLFKS
jgi:hypothetical protein